ncbi:MAG: molybdopterin converting factor subunit 1 [Candidatus Bathyarchaeota archaeon]|nr:molybdopterin converting factor subunit 1 [Candidatus Bathyarchaeota archaeon]
MKIKVKYYASFRDMTGKNEEVLEVKDGITVKGIRDHVRGIYEKIAQKEQVLVAVNGTFTQLDEVIKEGDDVAFFPPVSGG